MIMTMVDGVQSRVAHHRGMAQLVPSPPVSAGSMGPMPRRWHLERYPGMHVAIDMKADEVVLVADTPQQLHEQIQALGLRNVATMRVPTEDEPLFVSLPEFRDPLLAPRGWYDGGGP